MNKDVDFRKTNEFKILNSLIIDQNLSKLMDNSWGILNRIPEPLRRKMYNDIYITQKMAKEIILYNTGKKELKFFTDEEFNIFEKIIESYRQSQLNFLNLYKIYPIETKESKDIQELWVKKFTETLDNILKLAKNC